MVEESKKRLQAVLDEVDDDLSSVPMKVTAYGSQTSPEELQTYVSCVQFLAYWFEKQDGAAGLTTAEQFEQLRENVCAIMALGATKV